MIPHKLITTNTTTIPLNISPPHSSKNSGDIGFHSALADSLTKSPRKSPFGKKKSEGIQIGEATPVASRKTSEDFSSAIDEEQQEP